MGLDPECYRMPLYLLGVLMIIIVITQIVHPDGSQWDIPSNSTDFSVNYTSSNPSGTAVPTAAVSAANAKWFDSLDEPLPDPAENPTLIGDKTVSTSEKLSVNEAGEPPKDEKLDIEEPDAVNNPALMEDEDEEPTGVQEHAPLRTLSHQELQQIIGTAVKDALRPYEVLLQDCRKAQGLA